MRARRREVALHDAGQSSRESAKHGSTRSRETKMVRLHAVSWMMVVSMAAICLAGVETFTWEDGRFTILFADKPKVGQQVDQAARRRRDDAHLHRRIPPADRGDGGELLRLSPAGPRDEEADEMLDDSVTGTIQGMKAKLVKSGRITQAGAPGREFSWTSRRPQGSAQGPGPDLPRRPPALSGPDRRDDGEEA